MDSANLASDVAGDVGSAYVHVPFCVHRCGYCDFATVAGFDHWHGRYLDALERELALRLGQPRRVDTLFVGGGTPTRLGVFELSRLLGLLSRWLPMTAGAEYTFEANPGTLDEAKVSLLADHGVNRVSLGAQSFRPATLRVLERDHDPVEISRALALVRSRISNVSIDLIFGVPGTTLDDWRRDLDEVEALGLPHVSCYNLIFEKGTPLWKARDAGLIEPLDENIEVAMHEHTVQRLEDGGLSAYEISNFAREGYECRHNLMYWSNESFYGFGLGAARFLNGERAVNTRDLKTYLDRLEGGGDPTGPRERLNAEKHARETAILMLRRLRIGLERADFERRTGFSIDALAADAIRRGLARGWLEDDGARLRLTRAGVFVSDALFSEIV